MATVFTSAEEKRKGYAAFQALQAQKRDAIAAENRWLADILAPLCKSEPFVDTLCRELTLDGTRLSDFSSFGLETIRDFYVQACRKAAGIRAKSDQAYRDQFDATVAGKIGGAK